MFSGAWKWMLCAAFFLAAGHLRAEQTLSVSFDTDPGWTAVGSGLNGNDFGYWSSAFAGGQPGEGGGRFTRSDFIRYYADTNLGGSLDLSTPLQASGRLDVTDFNFPDFGPGMVLGYFDPAGSAAIGLVFNNTSSGGLYADARVRFEDGSEVSVPVSASLLPNVDRTWSIGWDSLGGTMGGGALVVSLSGPDAGTVELDLSPAERLLPAEFTAFGLSGASTSPLSGNPSQPDWYADLFIKDVTYTVATPEPSGVVLLGTGAVVLVVGRWWRRLNRNVER